ncbi:MAG TPA: flagellar motor switch protein FliN [Thermodesulfatator sp.]|nr:flagellar motor switch protein FliN [Thermodesulfatator sp.]
MSETLSQEELDKLLAGEEQESQDKEASPEEKAEAKEASPEAGSSEDIMAEWDKAFSEAEAAKEEPKESPEAKEARFQEFREDKSGDGRRPSLDFLLDIPLEISVEIGRTKMVINDLLQLGQGSIIELNKMAGEPAEIYVNHKLMAKGEVVVVNEKFGVRLMEIISPQERVKQLG